MGGVPQGRPQAGGDPPYLDAAEKAGQSAVVAIGEAREFQWVFDATKKDGPDGVPWFRFYRTERL